jgi:hypothetical protein
MTRTTRATSPVADASPSTQPGREEPEFTRESYALPLRLSSGPAEEMGAGRQGFVRIIGNTSEPSGVTQRHPGGRERGPPWTLSLYVRAYNG